MTHSKRFNEPDPMTIYIMNGGDLCHVSESFCNRSDMGISSFRYGENGSLTTARPFLARFESMRARTKRLNKPDLMTI